MGEVRQGSAAAAVPGDGGYRGGADPLYLAQTLVHAIDAHLHRVLTRRRLDTNALMTLVLAIISAPQD